ncbi:hypothetical protein M378DRAFT_161904 [Amanita muscaria Koide BX008]|uniref:Uncharacterized protein n=1 Tax=Amanita muscaria (strain Koide BX008) TaxID=946122 RepID=A0A0C2SQP2_AMAMK|nr:hypothetical protein M378DRAFT_161904 [Amanita muscaria Koide BX008]
MRYSVDHSYKGCMQSGTKKKQRNTAAEILYSSCSATWAAITSSLKASTVAIFFGPKLY